MEGVQGSVGARPAEVFPQGCGLSRAVWSEWFSAPLPAAVWICGRQVGETLAGVRPGSHASLRDGGRRCLRGQPLADLSRSGCEVRGLEQTASVQSV